MSLANPLWGAPRIHGELLKLGIDVGQTSVAKYMARRRAPPSQGWKTFVRNHVDGIAAMDLFVVPTVSFRLLYGLLVMRHCRRRIVWLGVTAHPTAEWLANQLVEACGWEPIPNHLIRDRDACYGEVFVRRVRSLGIRDQPHCPAVALAEWQCGATDRLDPQRMPRPYRGGRRATPAARPVVLHGILQWSAHSSVVMQGCTDRTCRPIGRARLRTTNAGRASPSICPDLICDKDRSEFRQRNCTVSIVEADVIVPPWN
jgi:hypothetical protein